MGGTVSYSRLEGPAQTSTGEANPFNYRLDMRPLDWAKVVINTFWLLPLRLFLIVIPSVVMGTIVMSLSILGDRFDERNPHPLRGWRRFLSNTVGGRLSRIFLFGMGFHWIRVRGQPAHTGEAPIWVVAPHSSMLDMFIISIFGLPTYVAKQEVRSMPLFGFLITRALRTIYVARNDPGSRAACTEEIQRRASDRQQGWPKVMLFPEATTTSRQALLQFKKGAFLPGLPVQAVVIKFQNRLNTMVWSDQGLAMVTGLYLTICQLHNSLEVEFLPIYSPSEEEEADPELFAAHVRCEVREVVGCALSSYSVEDMLLCRLAFNLGLPYSAGLVSYPSAQRELQLSLPDIKHWLKRYVQMDRDGDGFLTEEDFVQSLAVPKDACTHTVFATLCKVGEDKVDFRSYLYGMVGRSLPFSTNEALHSMFQMFDVGGQGLVKQEDVMAGLFIQWKELAIDRGSQPQRRKGCDMCGCGRGRKKLRARQLDPQLTFFPPEMTFNQFCGALRQNREYLLLYHKRQMIANSHPHHYTSSPPPLSLFTSPLSSSVSTSSYQVEVDIENY